VCINKNLAIANRSRVSCAHNMSRASIYDNPVTLKSRLTVTQDHWKRNHSVDHTRLTISRVIGRWILSWSRNVGQRSLKVIEINAIRKLGCGFLFSYLPSIVPGERATSCGGRGYKEEAAIFVDVCACHTIFVSYDDWWPRVLRHCATCLEYFAIQRHFVWDTRHLQASSENASFRHVIPLIFFKTAHIWFCFVFDFEKCSWSNL